MSGNAKFSLIALAFFLSGCGGGILAKGVPITIEYDLSAKVLPVISSKQKVTLFLSVEDGRADIHPNQPDNLQAIESENSIGLHSETPLPNIVFDSLESELNLLGIKITNNKSHAQGHLKAVIKKFSSSKTGVLSGSYLSIVDIDLELIKPEENTPVFKTTIHGEQDKPFNTWLSAIDSSERLTSYNDIVVRQMKTLNAAYSQALDKLRRNKKFKEVLRGIAVFSPQYAEKESTPEEQTPQSGSGSGFFVSKMGHVITNAHVVQNCKKITIGDNANKQVPAELINTDRSNDLALLKLSTLEMASAESKSLIQKLGIVVVPLASKGLLRSEDVKLGEKVLVAGYPFGELFSNTIKVTSGIVSATRGSGDDSGQFQLDAAVQPGNSGGPIYDSGGNIVGVVVSQLDKRMVEKAIGSMPENVNFGIKASTVRQFLISSGVPSKKSERTKEKSTEQLAEIAKNQALMVMCLQTESFEQTAESIAEERKKLGKERERIAALQNLQEEKQKLEEERRLFKEEQDRLVRLQTKKRISTKAWRESITDLGNTLIRNIPPGKEPVLGVIPFKDLKTNRVTPFSRILNEDIKTILVRAEDLKLKEIKIDEGKSPEEIAEVNSLDYYITGSYRMERRGLEIRSRLIDTQTKNIQSSANIVIKRKELIPDDLALIDTMSDESNKP